MSARPEPEFTDIVPFWNRLGEITRYPAHWSAMIPIVLLGLAHWLLLIPFGFIAVLFAVIAMYRYAFDCLRMTANGELEPPDIQWSDDNKVGWKFIGLIFVLAIAVGICFGLFGTGAGIIILLLVGLALPSAIITLAMTNQFGASLNPTIWISIITRIGWPYLAAVGLFLVVFFSERFAQVWVARVMPLSLAIILVSIIANYALVVTFHLMGYLVYQYHEALGFEPRNLQIREAQRPLDPDQDVLDGAAALVRNGKPDEAAAHLKNHINSRGGTFAVHEQYRKLLHITGDKDSLLGHGQKFLPALLAQGKDRAALELMRECRTIDPTFAPIEAQQVTRLAQLAAQAHHAKLALQLLSGFHKRFPGHPDIVENYLLVATLMHRELNQDNKALQLLKSLKSNYPDTPFMPEIEECLAAVEQMLAATGNRGLAT